MKAFVHHVSVDQVIDRFRYLAAEVRLLTGAWVVFAKGDVHTVGEHHHAAVVVRLTVNGLPHVSSESVINLVDGPDQITRETFALSLGIDMPGNGNIQLFCDPAIDRSVSISNITISAIPVDAVIVTQSGTPPEPTGPSEGSSAPLVGFQAAPPLYVMSNESKPLVGFQAAPPLWVKSEKQED